MNINLPLLYYKISCNSCRIRVQFNNEQKKPKITHFDRSSNKNGNLFDCDPPPVLFLRLSYSDWNLRQAKLMFAHVSLTMDNWVCNQRNFLPLFVFIILCNFWPHGNFWGNVSGNCHLFPCAKPSSSSWPLAISWGECWAGSLSCYAQSRANQLS